MNAFNVAIDVCREAVARRFVAVVAALILLSQVGLLLALDIDVVEGVIRGSAMFGRASDTNNGEAVEAVIAPALRAIVLVVFYLGTLFGIVATSDIAIRLLSPGRIELALSLPIRRWELGVGIYLGVLLLALAGMTLAVSGFSLILFWKAEFATVAPFVGAISAALGFATVYSVMLLASVLIRSQALASGAGLALFIVSLATSDRTQVVTWFERGWPRDIASVVIAPLPRLQSLVTTAWDMASGTPDQLLPLAGITGGALLFAAACVTAACAVIGYRDY